jgi:glycosyltransferase involved in cell wall biosynthesis
MRSLTVITVTYNAEEVLERTLKSVREQTYPHIEHIVVDGKSQDGTLALIRQQENPCLKWGRVTTETPVEAMDISKR